MKYLKIHNTSYEKRSINYQYLLDNLQRRVQDLFHQGQISSLWEAELFLLNLKNYLPLGLGYNKKEGADYLIIVKKRLVLASASYAPHESFFHQGQKLVQISSGNYLKVWFIRGITPLCQTARHASDNSHNLHFLF